MTADNISLKSRVYGRICASAPAAVWAAGDFFDFGPPEAIRKVLQRLEEEGKIRRVDRGLYDRPRLNQLTGQPASTDYRALIEAMARRDQARMLVDGMTAANELGLSDAVSGRVIVHTDARLKPVKLENLTVTFMPTATSKLYWAGRPAMRIVQALHWLKPKMDDPAETERIKQHIIKQLSDRAHGSELRRDLARGLSSLPDWMQDFLRDLVIPKKSSTKSPSSKRKKAVAGGPS